MSSTTPQPPGLAMHPAASGTVHLGGLLGDALAANHRGRLSTFIVDEQSPAVALFDPARARRNFSGDWYGEHAGKWLYAATRAAARTGDAELLARVRRVADYLVGVQEDSGYLGTYAPERRFIRQQPPKPETWDGAPSARTWDVWVESCLVLGFLELHRHFPDQRYLDAARRIGDLCWRVLTDGGIDITELGNHHGMSASVLMDAAVELHSSTGEARYLDLALLILEQADRHPRLALLTRALGNADAAEIGTGKAYQLIWNVLGIAKLYRATGDAQFLQAAVNVWRNIRERHLTLGGGPWGGVAHRSREVFNPGSVFSPYGYVETCSTFAWMQLNRELLALTGEARYAEEIERSAYNDLLGAQAPNGEDWCCYSFPNGRRVHTGYWRCCKSSGAMALEELPAHAYGVAQGGGLRVNLLGASRATLPLPGGGSVRLEQRTAYPFDGAVEIGVAPDASSRFEIGVRVPEWARGASLQVNKEAVGTVALRPGTYASIERLWRSGDVISLDLPLEVRTHRRTHRNLQESLDPEGAPVSQEVLHFDYVGLTRGPLVYATDLIDGYKVEETLRLPDAPENTWLETLPAEGETGADIRLHARGRGALRFSPYYRAGGRRERAWRLTWMTLAPEEGS